MVVRGLGDGEGVLDRVEAGVRDGVGFDVTVAVGVGLPVLVAVADADGLVVTS